MSPCVPRAVSHAWLSADLLSWAGSCSDFLHGDSNSASLGSPEFTPGQTRACSDCSKRVDISEHLRQSRDRIETEVSPSPAIRTHRLPHQDAVLGAL